MSLNIKNLDMPVKDGDVVEYMCDAGPDKMYGELCTITVGVGDIVFIGSSLVGINGLVPSSEYRNPDLAKYPKPCPFCGYRCVKYYSQGHWGYGRIVCRKCQAVGPSHNSLSHIGDKHEYTYHLWWNYRAEKEQP